MERRTPAVTGVTRWRASADHVLGTDDARGESPGDGVKPGEEPRGIRLVELAHLDIASRRVDHCLAPGAVGGAGEPQHAHAQRAEAARSALPALERPLLALGALERPAQAVVLTRHIAYLDAVGVRGAARLAVAALDLGDAAVEAPARAPELCLPLAQRSKQGLILVFDSVCGYTEAQI